MGISGLMTGCEGSFRQMVFAALKLTREIVRRIRESGLKVGRDLIRLNASCSRAILLKGMEGASVVAMPKPSEYKVSSLVGGRSLSLRRTSPA